MKNAVAKNWILTAYGGRYYSDNLDPSAGEDDLFSMDFSEGAAPNAGWGSARTSGDQWTRTHLPTGSSSGGPAYRITRNYSTTAPFGGDYSYGWGASPFTLPASGESLFMRLRMRITADTDFQGRDQGDGSDTHVSRDKIIIIGDGSATATSRFILGLVGEGTLTGGPKFKLTIGIDGGVDQQDVPDTDEYYPADDPSIDLGDWFDCQVEIRYTSSLNAGDGYYKCWMNNNVYASPTQQVLNINMNRPNTNTLSFGYMNNGLVSGTQNASEYERLGFGTTFVSM